jgi:hypothetical protein
VFICKHIIIGRNIDSTNSTTKLLTSSFLELVPKRFSISKVVCFS